MLFRTLFLLSSGLLAVQCQLLATSYGSLPTDHNTSPAPDLKWTGADFSFPCPTTRALFKSSGKYVYKANIATRGQLYRDTLFFALPRFKAGVPATLVKTKLRKGACSTTFEPFPCWSMQEEGKCSALQSVVDTVLDANDILWVLDTGIVNTMEDKPTQKCPPKVMAFNTRTGKLLKTITLDSLTTKSSRLQYLSIDYGKDGRAFVYVSDASTRALLVYDVQANRGYRVILPKATTEGCGSKKDVLYLALVKKPEGNSVLYFTYLCSKKIFSIKTEYLRDGRASGKINDSGTKTNKLVIIGTDNGNAIFFRFEGQPEVYKWDTCTPFTVENFFVVYRSDSCQLATHAIADYKQQKMRVLESNFPDYIQGKVGCGAVQQISVMTGCF